MSTKTELAELLAASKAMLDADPSKIGAQAKAAARLYAVIRAIESGDDEPLPLGVYVPGMD